MRARASFLILVLLAPAAAIGQTPAQHGQFDTQAAVGNLPYQSSPLTNTTIDGTTVGATTPSTGTFSVVTLAGAGRVNLDTAGTMWVQEIAGAVVIGTGTTRLMSLSASGNLTTLGTITASGTP